MVDSSHPLSSTGFSGVTVAAFESRMGKEMSHLITRHGGKPLVAPSMQEIPLENNIQALEFGQQLLMGHIDLVILLTGVGTRRLVEVWKTKWKLELLTRALGQTSLVARGPKSVMALKELGLMPSLVVPEPNTWEDLLRIVDESRPEGLKGMRVAVQEYGVTNPELIQALTVRGADVLPVPVYRWALPDDLEPLMQVLNSIREGRVEVVLFTNAAQVDHIFQVVNWDDHSEQLRMALAQTMVASIGQITSDRLKHYGISVDLEPSHPKMGILVKEASQRAGEFTRKERNCSAPKSGK